MGTPITGIAGSTVNAAVTGPSPGQLVKAQDVNGPFQSITDDLATLKAKGIVVTRAQGLMVTGGETIAGLGASFADTASFLDLTGCKVGDMIEVTMQTTISASSSGQFVIEAYEDHLGANVLVSVGFTYSVLTTPRWVNMIGSWVVAHAGVARVILRTQAPSGQNSSYTGNSTPGGDGFILVTRLSLGL